MEYFYFPMSHCIFCRRAITNPLCSNHLEHCDEYAFVRNTYFSHSPKNHCEFCGVAIGLHNIYRHMDTKCKIIEFYKRRVRYCEISPIDLAWLPFAEYDMTCSFLGVIVSYVGCNKNTIQSFSDAFPYYYVYCILSDETYPKYSYKFNVVLYTKEEQQCQVQPGYIIYGFNSHVKLQRRTDEHILETTTEHKTLQFFMKQDKSLWSIYKPSGEYVGGSSLRPYDKHIMDDLVELEELAKEFNAHPKLLPEYTYEEYENVEREMDSRAGYPMDTIEPVWKTRFMREIAELRRVERKHGASSTVVAEEPKGGELEQEEQGEEEQLAEVALEEVKEGESDEVKEGEKLSVLESEHEEAEDPQHREKAKPGEEEEEAKPAITASMLKEWTISRRSRQARVQRRGDWPARLRSKKNPSTAKEPAKVASKTKSH